MPESAAAAAVPGEGVRAMVLRAGELAATSDASGVRAALKDDPGAVVWLDLVGPIDEATNALLREGFGLHPLIIEDMVVDYLVPKLEEMPGYSYLLVHALSCEGKLEDFSLDEVDILVGPRWVVTHHHNTPSVVRVRGDALKTKRLLEKGPAWLVHELLDQIVDAYMPALQRFEDEVETIEEIIVEEQPTREVIGRVFALKRALMKVRRVASYQREILGRLGRAGSPFVPEAALPFFRDVYDHMGNISLLAESARELASNVLEMHLSMQSNRMNEVMKTLTMFSTTLMPLSLIAGIYGMNFESMPEIKWRYGYPMALGLMATVALGMLYFFRRKRWW